MKKLFLTVGLLFFASSAFATNPCKCYGKTGDSQHVYNTCTDGETGVTTIPSGFTFLYNATNSNSTSNPVIPGSCTSQNGGCNGADCGYLTDSAYFDFHVQAGGVNSDLYVCEVGFNTHYCASKNEYCNNNDDYMAIYNKDGKVATIVHPNSQTFTLKDNVTYAKTFLNSLNMGAGWYVKYCQDLTRLTVGNEGYGYSFTDLIALIKGTVTVTPGKYMDTGAKDYFDIAKLAFSVDYGCGSTLQAEDANDTPDAVWDEVKDHSETMLTENSVCLNGQPGCVQKRCSWKVSFRETGTCVRPLKDKDKCPGPDCVPYEGTIHTTVNTKTTFTCQSGTCN